MEVKGIIVHRPLTLIIYVLLVFAFFHQGIALAEIGEKLDVLPIKRQTESEARDAMMKALLEKGDVPQIVDHSPEPGDENYRKPVSAFISLDEISKIFIPYASHNISDSYIQGILENAVIVKYEELTPLHLLPAQDITIVDKSGNHYTLSLFQVSDQRGVITLPNQQRLWFAVTNK